jgi:uncharacterized RDD family membrane protein YckC
MKKYAGFWQRTKAFGFDYLVISLYLILIILFFSALNLIFNLNQFLFTERVTAQVSGFLIITLPITLYFSFGESSAKQATWGKQRLDLKVTELNGNGITFWKAFIRTLLKFIPWEISHALIWNIYYSEGAFPDYANYGFTLVYLLMGLNIASLVMTKTKQSLYDFLAGTVVVNKI